ncbi:PAS domain-containing protein [Haloarcula laminariae]|uniref:PAS domain-containing protein n=1 Tax=Haloarcula laminariae TaxID=2961577 RepID=UPI0021C687B6|nr:PAS domain-containing protein [Halomicroarcula laminariae]
MYSGGASASLVAHVGEDRDAVVRAVESAEIGVSSVRSVGSIASALDAIAEGDVACLVCEYDLEDGTGLELLDELAARGTAPPTLFRTDDPEMGSEALAAGATDILVERDGVDLVPLLARRLRNVLATRTSERDDANESALGLLQSMYDVTTDQSASYERTVDRLLRLGCEAFGLSDGFLTRIEREGDDGTQTIVQAQGAHERLEPGASCPLSEAYCRKTIRTDGLLAVSNAVEAGWADDPAYEAFELGCYIGGKVVVGGELYGTLCFASTEPRAAPFTDLERTAVRLMSEWLGYELDRNRSRTELELKNRAMDEAPVGILISDPDQPDNPAVYVNDRFTEMTGYPPAAVLGRNCRFLQGEATRAEPVDRLREAVAKAEPAAVELRNYRRDGTEFWNRVTVAPIENDEGEVTNYVGFQEDVTERKEHELDLKLRDRAISAAPIGITLHDVTASEWPITYANAGFENITGYERASVEGEGASVLVGAETDERQLAALERAFEDGQAASETLLLYRADGDPFWGRVSIAPVSEADGPVTHAVGFLEDVTETREHAEEIERRLDEFGDVLAAELQTPLQEARSRLSADADELSADDLAAALSALERTDSLIDDLTTVHSFSVKSRDVFDTGGAAPGTDL